MLFRPVVGKLGLADHIQHAAFFNAAFQTFFTKCCCVQVLMIVMLMIVMLIKVMMIMMKVFVLHRPAVG